VVERWYIEGSIVLEKKTFPIPSTIYRSVLKVLATGPIEHRVERDKGCCCFLNERESHVDIPG
jgi:hypothetical protein